MFPVAAMVSCPRNTRSRVYRIAHNTSLDFLRDKSRNTVIPLTDDVERGFNTMMEDVVHHSRIAMGVSCLGLATRAYQIARVYADERTVFGHRVIDHALAQENLAEIRAACIVSHDPPMTRPTMMHWITTKGMAPQ